MENIVPAHDRLDFDIYQYRCFGYSLEDTAAKFNLPVDLVQEAIERYCTSRGIHTQRTSDQRKALALARLDMATKAIMPKVAAGDHPAIHAYLKIQERESKLTGMDNPSKHDTRISIDIPWLTKERLTYKDQPNVVDITPAIEVKKQLEQAVQDTPRLVQETQRPQARADGAWKEPETQGLAHILRNPDKPD